MIPHRVTAALAALLLTLSPTAPEAQPPAPSAGAPVPSRLSPAERDAALRAITTELSESYVFPEKRAGIIARLEQARKAGRYDVDTLALLAERVTADLADASHDLHLSLRHDPAQYAAAQRTATRAAEGENSEVYWRQRAHREHHGMLEQRLLPGNIRYLKLGFFHWINDETGAVHDAAMRFLREGDALIIDLRGNGGGSSSAVRYLISHFLEANTLELTFLESTRPPEQSRTVDHLPAGRVKGKPLYVLVDGGTASAAESFTYDVQQFKLGTLVGTRTAGAANNNALVPVSPGFIFSISRGRPVHPVSQTNWEGVGISPDVEAPPAQALDMAESLALGRLAQAPGITPQAQAEYAWARTSVEARLNPVTVTPARLKGWAGRYASYEVSFRDGALWLSRQDRPTRRLVPLTADGLFSIEGTDNMLRARFTPQAMETLARGDPNPRVFTRG